MVGGCTHIFIEGQRTFWVGDAEHRMIELNISCELHLVYLAVMILFTLKLAVSAVRAMVDRV